MQNQFDLTPEQARLIYLALRRNDGSTLAPDFSKADRAALTLACDRLRLILLDIYDPNLEDPEVKR